MTAMIKGAKGGSDKQRTPVESPDSLVSTAYARLIDLISEGEIFGLVNGASSIYLDETPAQTGAGESFSGFSWEQRVGTQAQSYLAGFPQVENEITVGVELHADSPWVRSITNADLSAVRINFSVPRLAKQDTNTGDTTGYRVDYAIDLAVGVGSYQEVLAGSFNGKTAGGYERSVRIDLPEGSGGWRVRVRRMTPNSTSSAIVDAISIKSLTEIIDAKFRYPNSAIVGVSFDAETFGGSVPKRGYHARGRILRVPSNYEPETRTYLGIWDGTFKLAYSNNPAWVYYDLLLHPRYGLGDRIDATQVDKWALYQIAQYCDQKVSDGMGGLEPRFTCNLYLQTRADAYRVLQDIAAIFRGITYWGAGQAIVSADMPADPVYTYTNANVKDGKFTYKGSKRSTRYSAVVVGWNDPADMYRPKVEYVQDEDAVARFGLQKSEISVLGCTSQGQAQRAGRWALLTNLLETETVTFGVGLDGIRARPGQIIRVADNARAGRRIGGRVSSATTTTVTVDKIDGPMAGDELTCILPTGEAQTRTVLDVDGRSITVSPAFDAAPVAQSVWAWESEQLATQRYRIVSISESAPLEYAITASKYVEGKHASVDSGAIISQRPITSIPASVQPAPANIRATSDWMLQQTLAVTTMTIMWDAAEGATRYDVEWRRGEGAWVYAGRVATNELDVVGIYAGTYQIRVRALNSLDVASPWSYSEAIELAGKAGAPPAVAFLSAKPEIFGIRLAWGFPAGAEDTLKTEVQYNGNPQEEGATHLGDYAYPIAQHLMAGLSAGTEFHFRARLIDRTGNIGPWSGWVLGQASSDAGEYNKYFAGLINESALGQHLQERIDLIDGDGPGSVNDRLSQVADALAYDPAKTYAAGETVRQGQRLYQAAQDVPAETPPPNATYWLDLGQVAQAANALAVQVEQNTTRIEQTEQGLQAQSERLEGVYAQVNPPLAGDASWMAGSTGVLAGAWSLQYVIASETGALAERIDQVEASVGEDLQAVVQETATAVADLEAGVQAMYSIKLQVGQDGTYYAAGMGIGIENTPEGMQSQVLFQADRFAVINTANGQIASPFVIQGGQVFINEALIGTATIQNALVGATLESVAKDSQGNPLVRINLQTGAFELRAERADGRRTLQTPGLTRVYQGNTLRVQLGIWD